MITLDDLKQICPQASVGRMAVFLEALNAAMDEFGISENVARETAFIAQVAHESGGFRYMEEIASGADYDHRDDLGNTRPEAIEIAARHGSTPGRWWKGHGPIQITGYDNHKACGEALGLDLLENPRLLTDPGNGMRAAGWFWRDYKHLNELADAGDFLRITKRINGGTNGMDDRLAYFERAKTVLA